MQMLQPLLAVTAALERFASGDLTPQPIGADPRKEFGRLAIAYNGAIEQMERAFAERERVNASMRQFIADAGHQLRTPLTVIRGFLGILLRGELRTPSDRDRILETMSGQTQIMASLIEKLMLLEQWESGSAGEAEPIDVGQLVSDVALPIAEANAGRELRIDAHPGPLAAIDPGDLTHAVTNLLDNAIKYSQGTINVGVYAENGSVGVDVVDEGPGIDPQAADHVFDRFYRGDNRDVPGSGLGLAIAKRAIERAGGTLTLRSNMRGSRFTITLPRSE
jgi:two-component system OmpR family sensor kinase